MLKRSENSAVVAHDVQLLEGEGREGPMLQQSYQKLKSGQISRQLKNSFRMLSNSVQLAKVPISKWWLIGLTTRKKMTRMLRRLKMPRKSEVRILESWW